MCIYIVYSQLSFHICVFTTCLKRCHITVSSIHDHTCPFTFVYSQRAWSVLTLLSHHDSWISSWCMIHPTWPLFIESYSHSDFRHRRVFADGHTTQTDKQTDRVNSVAILRPKNTDRQTDKQTDRVNSVAILRPKHTDNQTDRQADRQG
jgi:hypothetical protein